jgi:hypothetical protein
MRLLRCFVFLATAVFAAAFPTCAARAQAPTIGSSPIVYVSDFDLDVIAYRKPVKRVVPPPEASAEQDNSSHIAGSGVRVAPSTSNSSRAKTTDDAAAEQTPDERAKALLNAVSENLLRALRQAGYHAERLSAGAPVPKTGLRIRGVFAEADESNRARRLLIGGTAVSPNMTLFVGVNNLTRPEQPLYLLADPPYPDPRHGPVITVTSYAPAARYELPRDPGDEELKKVSAKIATSLTELLSANPLLSLE